MILRALLKMIEKMVRFWSALEIRGDWLIFRQSTESETLAADLLLLPDLRRRRPDGLRVTARGHLRHGTLRTFGKPQESYSSFS